MLPKVSFWDVSFHKRHGYSAYQSHYSILQNAKRGGYDHGDDFKLMKALKSPGTEVKYKYMFYTAFTSLYSGNYFESPMILDVIKYILIYFRSRFFCNYLHENSSVLRLENVWITGVDKSLLDFIVSSLLYCSFWDIFLASILSYGKLRQLYFICRTTMDFIGETSVL